VLASHPYPPKEQAWELDALILRTLQALNQTYQSPYQRQIEFPISERTPAKERKELENLIQSLPKHGVPDTIAYLTEAVPASKLLNPTASLVRSLIASWRL